MSTKLIDIVINSVLCDDLDDALLPIQAELGVATGDTAGLFCQEWDWPTMSAHERMRELCNYVSFEILTEAMHRACDQ